MNAPSRSHFAALLLAMTVAVATASSQNLVTNPDFTTGSDSWTTPTATVEAVYRSDLGSDLEDGSGPGCLEVRHSAWIGSLDGAIQEIADLRPGVRVAYQASYMRPSTNDVGQTAVLYLVWYDAQGVTVAAEGVYTDTVSTDTWQRLKGTSLVPSSAQTAELWLAVATPFSEDEDRPGVIFFDDAWFSTADDLVTSQVLFVPAAAAAQGFMGTYWSTTGWFASTIDTPLTLSGAFLPQNSDNTARVENLLELGTIEPHGYLEIEDIVTLLGGAGATGALVLRAEASDPTEPEILFRGITYTFTPNPRGAGSYGQGLPAVASGRAVKVVIPGLYQNDQFRTNIGVLNTSPQTITLLLTIRGSRGEVVNGFMWSLPPYGHRQVPLANYGLTNLNGGTAVFSLTAGSGSFRAYASTVDEVTGDAVYNAAQDAEGGP